MFIKNAIFIIVIILATVIFLYFPIVILSMFPKSNPMNRQGLSAFGQFMAMFLVQQFLPIIATLEIGLVGVLTYQGWIPRNLGIIAIFVFLAIVVIDLISIKLVLSRSNPQ